MGCLDAGGSFCSCVFEILVILLSSSFLLRTEYFVFYIFFSLGSKSLLTRTLYSLLPTTQKFSQTVDCLPAKGRGAIPDFAAWRGPRQTKPAPSCCREFPSARSFVLQNCFVMCTSYVGRPY